MRRLSRRVVGRVSRTLPALLLLNHQFRCAVSKVEMPALSPTMNSGTIVAWKKKVGDRVAPGDVYCEVQTDKATLDYENVADEGILARILRSEGSDAVNVGDSIALLVDDPSEMESPAVLNFGNEAVDASQPATHAAEKVTSSSKLNPVQSNLNLCTKGTPVSPYARSVARELKVDPQNANPTGGMQSIKRVTADDVRRYATSNSTAQPVKPVVLSERTSATNEAPARLQMGAPLYEDVPLSPMRRIIASRLHQSKNSEVPHYYISADIAVESALKVISHLRQKTQKKISINDYIIRAVAKATMVVPEARTHFILGSDTSKYQGADTFLRRYNHVDVSVAVATDGGLLTPIVRDADRKGIAEISDEVKELAAKARNGALRPEEYQGGTVSVSNLGPMGVHHFTAIINPPQSLILAVGTTRYRARLTSTPPSGSTGLTKEEEQNSQLYKKMYVSHEAEPYITCTASFDHRVIDGAIGAKWMQQLQENIENPLSLLA